MNELLNVGVAGHETMLFRQSWEPLPDEGTQPALSAPFDRAWRVRHDIQEDQVGGGVI